METMLDCDSVHLMDSLKVSLMETVMDCDLEHLLAKLADWMEHVMD